MTFNAALARVMVFDLNLFEPFRTGWAGFMTADTMTEGQLLKFDVGIIHVGRGGTMAAFTRQRLVLRLSQFLNMIRVALVAGFLTREHKRPARQLTQRICSVPPQLTERPGRQKGSSREVSSHDHQG